MINFELVSHLLIFSQFSRIIKTNYRHCSLLPGLEGSLVHRGNPAPLFYYSYLGTIWGEGQGLLHLKVSGQGPHFLLGVFTSLSLMEELDTEGMSGGAG